MVMDRGTVELAQSLELVPKARKGPVLKLEPDDVTGQSHESTQKKKQLLRLASNRAITSIVRRP